MKLVHFSALIDLYGKKWIEEEDLEKRNETLKTKPFSLIFEGDSLEIDSLEKWIKRNLNRNDLSWIYYGKLDYDYGCMEYFSKDEKGILKLKEVIPKIYTVYRHKTYKTNGCWNMVEYSKEDKNAIIVQ